MSASSPRLGIVVVNYGAAGLLRRHLASIDLGAISGGSAIVVVVDNPSTPSDRAAVDELADQHGWQVVRPERNVGFGAGANLGAARALESGCDVVALLNPDLAVDAAALATLAAAARDRPLALCSARIERPDGSLWFAGGRLDPRTGLTTTTGGGAGADRWLTGACLALHRQLWERVGGFDPAYFLYWEDVDLSRRVLDAGGELVVVEEAAAVHDVGGTQRVDGGRSALYASSMCRNRLRYAARHLPPAARLRWVANAPRYALRVARRDGGRAALRRPSVPLAALWGTLTGTAIVLRSLVRPRPRA